MIIELTNDEVDIILDGLAMVVNRGKNAKKGKSKSKCSVIDKNYKKVNELYKFFQGK